MPACRPDSVRFQSIMLDMRSGIARSCSPWPDGGKLAETPPIGQAFQRFSAIFRR